MTQGGSHRLHDPLRREAEEPEQLTGRCRLAEAIEADDGPSRPTYLRQKSLTPASTATHGSAGGSTLSR